jgi:hypothetical protein
MKKIPLLPFFDLYAGTWNQQDLFNEIRTVYPEADSINVINNIGKHMLSVGTPQGLNLDTDCVLERLRSNQYDADLILDWYTDKDGSLGERKHGYQSCWAGVGFQIAFKQRYPDPVTGELEKYYNPVPNLSDYFALVGANGLEETPADTIARLSARLAAYESVYGGQGLTIDQIRDLQPPRTGDDGAGNRSKAQFDEPDEPSLFVADDVERLNPTWVLYMTNYHRGLLTQEQVGHVGASLLKQLQQCSPERLRDMGPRGIPNVLTKHGHVSMAWVVYFKNTHQPDFNFGQITRLGHTVAEQVKAYKPRAD